MQRSQKIGFNHSHFRPCIKNVFTVLLLLAGKTECNAPHFNILYAGRVKILKLLEHKTLLLGKTHIKKSVFLVFGPLRFYPPYTNGLVAHVTFF